MSDKICPLTKEVCNPFTLNNVKSSNTNCTFFYIDEELGFGKCLYIESLRAIPKIAEGIKKIKLV